MIEVDRVRIHCQQREPRVVGREDRPTQRMLVHVADDEVFVDASGPPLFHSHTTPSSCHVLIVSASNPNSPRTASVCSPSAGIDPITGTTPSMRTGGTSARIGPTAESISRHA